MGGRASGVARSGETFNSVPFCSISFRFPHTQGPGRAAPQRNGRHLPCEVEARMRLSKCHGRERDDVRVARSKLPMRRLQRTSVAGSAAYRASGCCRWFGGGPNHCGGSAPWRRCGSTVIRSALLTNVTRTLGSPHQPPERNRQKGLRGRFDGTPSYCCAFSKRSRARPSSISSSGKCRLSTSLDL